ncbi:hypothetical protein [Marinomonas sp. THO17]|uniref:hypothetical protein n=1 Tax=Marinomonas sp. THO17 TaxID=3149048 RepID=UPI00336C272C
MDKLVDKITELDGFFDELSDQDKTTLNKQINSIKTKLANVAREYDSVASKSIDVSNFEEDETFISTINAIAGLERQLQALDIVLAKLSKESSTMPKQGLKIISERLPSEREMALMNYQTAVLGLIDDTRCILGNKIVKGV